MKRKTKVYVAAPCSCGDVLPNADRWVNMIKAVMVCEELLRKGYVPFCPHLTMFWHSLYPHSYREWLDYDSNWLKVCDCLLRIGGGSSGADEEVNDMTTISKPVFESTMALYEQMPNTMQ